MRDSEIASAFLDSFSNCENKGEITYGVCLSWYLDIETSYS
jgi:hypothetical protein